MLTRYRVCRGQLEVSWRNRVLKLSHEDSESMKREERASPREGISNTPLRTAEAPACSVGMGSMGAGEGMGTFP